MRDDRCVLCSWFESSRKCSWVQTYHHAHPGLLSIRLLLHRIIQNHIQKDVVAAQGARDAAGAVELDQEALVEVL